MAVRLSFVNYPESTSITWQYIMSSGMVLRLVEPHPTVTRGWPDGGT